MRKAYLLFLLITFSSCSSYVDEFLKTYDPQYYATSNRVVSNDQHNHAFSKSSESTNVIDSLSQQDTRVYPSFSSITMERNDKGMVRFLGRTNLPDGFRISVDLTEGDSHFWFGLTNVQNGHFMTDFDYFNAPAMQRLFDSKGQGVNGWLNLTIHSPVADAQPKAIQALIGKQGKSLAGINVEEIFLGSVERVIKYTTQFNVKQNGEWPVSVYPKIRK